MFANLVSTPGMPTPPVATAAATRNHSILDGALADIKELQGKLGKNDVAKLDDYFTSVRALETKLFTAAPMMVTSACTPGTQPDASLDNSDSDGNLSPVYIARVQAFFDMVALAFKCDLTRSVVFMYDGDGAARHLNNAVPMQYILNGASMTGELHLGISHYSNDNGRDKCVTRDRMYMSLFFYLLDQLRAGTDASGSAILDNTAVMAGFGVVDGDHQDGNTAGVPLVMGGGKNFMSPGQCIDLNGADRKDVFFTLGNYLGLGLQNFQGSTNLLKF
jgi:hypothetical protein